MVFLAKFELDRNAKFHLNNWRTSCFNKIRHFLGLEGSRLSGSVDNVLAKKPRTQDLNLVQRVLIGSSIGYFFVIPCAFSKSVYGKSLKPPLVSCLGVHCWDIEKTSEKAHHLAGFKVLTSWSQAIPSTTVLKPLHSSLTSFFQPWNLKKYQCITAAWFLF